MKRKSFILLIAFLLIAFSTVCFANDMGNNIKNTINGATNTVVDGTQNLAEDVRSGVGTAENTIENGVNNVGNAVMDGANSIEDAGDDAYTTTRAVADDATTRNAMNSTTWVWVILAIAAIVIIGSVWFYASQHNH